jgi:hypothetical protein
MQPLSDHIADQLKDPTVALAAAFVIGVGRSNRLRRAERRP